MARQAPELRLQLPSTAIGKYYQGSTTFIDRAPSDTDWRLSLMGLAGVTMARDQGLQLNVLGLGFGIDVVPLIDLARMNLPASAWRTTTKSVCEMPALAKLGLPRQGCNKRWLVGNSNICVRNEVVQKLNN